MLYSEQRHAENSKVLALALQETLFTAAWAALAGALFLLFTELWFYALLPAALIAILFLVSMELSGEGSPLVALEIEQHRSDGSRLVSRRAVYFRILLSVVLFPLLLIGYVTLLFGKASVPELITGIRLTSVNKYLDPRDPATVKHIVRKAALRARTLILVPMAASAAMFILLHSAPSVMLLQPSVEENGLSADDQELLTHYLELTALHPEELEYHVRLASLYYRNNMQQDLTNELTVIEEMDSTHAILLLADTTSFTFNQLEPFSDDSTGGLYADVHIGLLTETHADSTQTDSTAVDSTVVDSTLVDSLSISPDTTELTTAADTLTVIQTDTVPEVSDTLPEAVQDTLPAIQEEEPADSTETVSEPAAEETPETEEESVEPDTLVQP